MLQILQKFMGSQKHQLEASPFSSLLLKVNIREYFHFMLVCVIILRSGEVKFKLAP